MLMTASTVLRRDKKRVGIANFCTKTAFFIIFLVYPSTSAKIFATCATDHTVAGCSKVTRTPPRALAGTHATSWTNPSRARTAG